MPNFPPRRDRDRPNHGDVIPSQRGRRAFSRVNLLLRAASRAALAVATGAVFFPAPGVATTVAPKSAASSAPEFPATPAAPSPQPKAPSAADELTPVPAPKPQQRAKKRQKKEGARSRPPSIVYESRKTGYGLGLRGLFDFDRRHRSYAHPYFQHTETLGFGGVVPFALVGSYRLLLDPLGKLRWRFAELDPRALYFERVVENRATYRVGLQETRWGESFGIPVADLPNPFDVTSLGRAELDDRKVPVVMLNLERRWGTNALQVLLTPQPRRSPSPFLVEPELAREAAEPALERVGPNTPVRVRPDNAHHFAADAEYGLRVRHQPSHGSELAPFVFRHWNRTPVYRGYNLTDGFEYNQIEALVTSAGMTGHTAPGPIAGRFELVYGTGIPASFPGDSAVYADSLKVRNADRAQGLVGADYALHRFASMLSLQLLGERWTKAPVTAGNESLAWAAVRAQTKLPKLMLAPELMLWRGLNNGDSWLSMRTAYRPAPPWRLHLEIDLMRGGGDGDAWLFRDRQTVYTRVEVSL